MKQLTIIVYLRLLQYSWFITQVGLSNAQLEIKSEMVLRGDRRPGTLAIYHSVAGVTYAIANIFSL